jgi:hypothetical protein
MHTLRSAITAGTLAATARALLARVR